MKGRSLRLDHTGRRALTRIALLAALAPFAASLAACGGDGGQVEAAAAALPGEAGPTSTVADDPVLVAPTTAAPSTTASPATVAETTPATTVPPTVVETLPVPDPPPPPRADEPYVELGRLQIPKIGIDTVLLQGITLNTLDLGPGHWPGTALPGQIGNTVIAGHRTSHNKVFRNIDQLAPGDEVIFTTSEGDFVYLVRETTVVKPDAMYIVEQTYEPTATLFACHPPGSTRERIVVHLDLSTAPVAPSV
jgi:sortase A